jgi:large subunit ribosomal protein L19
VFLKNYCNIASAILRKKSYKIILTMDLIKAAEQKHVKEHNYPNFKAGDTITVTLRIKEGSKERLQDFRGVVLQRKGSGITETFTVRKLSYGTGVERIFPLHSPAIEGIKLNKAGKVRRSRIYYLRKLKGKKARIKEK